MTWDDVLTSLVHRSFAAAQSGDCSAEGEAMRQFDLLVRFGGALDLVSLHAARGADGKGKA